MILLGHRLHPGSIAWLVHRVTGIALTIYLIAHLYVLSHLKDPEEFESLMRMSSHPMVKLGELGLLGLVAAHTLNGLRLTLIDLGAPTRAQKPLFWTAAAVAGGFVLYGARVILGGAH
jgi:succinate dehydrogenase / fumarate reductase cytochrome b subunit